VKSGVILAACDTQTTTNPQVLPRETALEDLDFLVHLIDHARRPSS
jgi:hypothetical protein